MPALPPAPQVLRLDFFFQIGEDMFAKVRQFRQYSGTAPTPLNLDSLCDNYMAAWAGQMPPFYTTETSLLRMVITDLTSPTSAVGISTHAAVPGTETSAHRVASACTLQKLDILRRYRGGHPRRYWPLLGPGDMADEQTWNPTTIASLNTAYADFLAAVGGAPWSGGTLLSGVNVSYYEGSHPFTGPTGRVRNIANVRSAPVIDAIVSETFVVGIASQRRRLLKLA